MIAFQQKGPAAAATTPSPNQNHRDAILHYRAAMALSKKLAERTRPAIRRRNSRTLGRQVAAHLVAFLRASVVEFR